MWILAALSILGTILTGGIAGSRKVVQNPVGVYVEPARVGIPVRLIIPVIGLDTQILSVNLNDKQLVDVPEKLAGWYAGGVRPSEEGNATLQAHVTEAFRNINKLNVEDEIRVVDETGKEIIFKVTEKELINKEDFDVQKVYGQTNKKRLNLITCAGNFDNGDFDKRTIVYSELAE